MATKDGEELTVTEWAALVFSFPFIVAARGWSLVWLWSWFVAGPFGVMQIRIAHAIGLGLLIGYLCKSTNGNDTQKDPMHKIIGGLIGPPIFVGTGWIIHQFM